jgi:hypothetical protein
VFVASTLGVLGLDNGLFAVREGGREMEDVVEVADGGGRAEDLEVDRVLEIPDEAIGASEIAFEAVLLASREVGGAEDVDVVPVPVVDVSRDVLVVALDSGFDGLEDDEVVGIPEATDVEGLDTAEGVVLVAADVDDANVELEEGGSKDRRVIVVVLVVEVAVGTEVDDDDEEEDDAEVLAFFVVGGVAIREVEGGFNPLFGGGNLEGVVVVVEVVEGEDFKGVVGKEVDGVGKRLEDGVVVDDNDDGEEEDGEDGVSVILN